MAYWNDIHHNTLAPMEFEPVDRETFDGSLSVDFLGPIAFAKAFARPASILRTEQHVNATRGRSALLGMTVKGRVRVNHYGREVELAAPGDFVLSDSAAPSRASLLDSNDSYALGIDYDLLTRYIPHPEAIFGLRVSGSRGLGHSVFMLVHSLWTQVERGLPARFGPGLARNVLELVAAAYAMEYSAEIAEATLAAGRRGQIKRFIETHLRDADLCASAVACGLGLSPRYVRMLFADEHESVSDYILRRRLEECAVQLASAPLASRSITEVAFEHGFSSLAHFTRSFKERYGVTPSQFKRSCAAPAERVAHG